MSKVSKVFGGGSKTSVNQQAANKTTVNVQNESSKVIDLTALAETLSETLKATSKQTQDLILNISKAQIVTNLLDLKQRTEQSERITAGIKLTAIAGAIYLLWRWIYD